MKISRYFFIGLIVAGVFLLGFSAGQSSIDPAQFAPNITDKTEGQPESIDFSQFWRVWGALHQEYIDAGQLQSRKLVEGAIKGMVRAAGDPYTVYLDPQESKNFADTISGSFEGIGAEIGIRDNRLTIIAPLKNTPAERAGLKAGDKVIRIDETPTTGMSLEEAVSRIKGPKGTKVVLTVERNGLEDVKKIEIIRDKINIPVLDWQLKQNNEVVYLQIFTFTENVTGRFRRAADEILKTGTDKLILDLRNNAGGVLQGAIEVAGWFVPEGKTVVIERQGEQETAHPSPGPGSFADWQVVIIVNEGSASASEILAGALQEQIGAQLVGAKTFGKGSVQTLRRFVDRSTLKVTVARWLTPQGKLIEGEGIEPDIKIEMEPDKINTKEDVQLQQAIKLINSN